jgi:tetratricopeptide (TPR) repeat protein
VTPGNEVRATGHCEVEVNAKAKKVIVGTIIASGVAAVGYFVVHARHPGVSKVEISVRHFPVTADRKARHDAIAKARELADFESSIPDINSEIKFRWLDKQIKERGLVAPDSTAGRTSIKLNFPNSPTVHMVLSRSCLIKPDNDRAIQEMEAAIRLDPASPIPVKAMGDLKFILGDRASAKTYWRKAFALRPERVRHPATDENNPWFQEAMARRLLIDGTMSTNAGVHVGYADALWRVGDIDGASQEYRKVIAMEPGQVDEHFYNIHAAGVFAGIVMTSFTDAHYGLANCLKDSGQIDAAITQYQIAHQAKPLDGRYAFGLASALALSNRAAEIIPLLTMLRQRLSDDAFSVMLPDYVSVDPDFDRVGNDPAIKKLLNR